MNTNILIIEDETAIQSILSELLTDAGYNIEVASDGLEGITKFRKKLRSKRLNCRWMITSPNRSP